MRVVFQVKKVFLSAGDVHAAICIAFHSLSGSEI